MKFPKLKLKPPKLPKLKLKKKKRKKSQTKKKIIKIPKPRIPKPKLPKRPERVDGRLTRTKEYTSLIYFAIGSIAFIIMLLINLEII